MRVELKLYRDYWHAVWLEDGETKRRSLRTKDRDVAERRLEDFKRDYRPELGTVAQIMEAYIEDRRGRVARISRIEDAWKRLKPHFGHLRPDQIGRGLCRTYVTDRRKARFRNRKQTTQDGTIIKELGVLRAALQWHDKNTPAVFEMPSAPPPRERHLTRDEYGRLLEAAERTPHLYLFVVLALATAGRAEAILELTWDRADPEGDFIDLRKGTGTRKGRARVPMTPFAREALRSAKKAALTDHVIEYAGSPVKSIKKAFERAAIEAEIADVTPHILRHTAAVWMAEDGNEMSEIAQFLGHADDRITQRVYARFSPTHLRKAASALDFKRPPAKVPEPTADDSGPDSSPRTT